MRVLICLLLLAGACNRSTESPRPSPEAATPPALVPSAAPSGAGSATSRVAPVPSASAAPGSAAALRLEVRPVGAAKVPTAFLTSAALGVDERVAEVPSPWTCRLTASGDGGTVTCGPDVRRVQLSIRTEPGALELSRAGATPKRVALPASTTATIAPTEVSARDLPEARCPDAAPAADAEIHFTHHWLMGSGHRLLMDFRAERGAPKALLLFEFARGGACHSEGTDQARHVRCDGAGTECDVRVENGTVGFSCTGKSPAAGRVLLPCGVRGRLVTHGTMGQASTYH